MTYLSFEQRNKYFRLRKFYTASIAYGIVKGRIKLPAMGYRRVLATEVLLSDESNIRSTDDLQSMIDAIRDAK